MATASLGAAWKIAIDQRRRAEQAERQALTDFVTAMLGLGQEAIDVLEELASELKSLEAEQLPGGQLRKWRVQTTKIQRTIDLVRTASPRDAKLALAAADLSAAAEAWDGAMMGAWRAHTAQSMVPRKLTELREAQAAVSAFLM